tara:strand:- start:216 stop:779 length:564 start_codon:yes stop_codon:yes gene_type:complete
MFSKKTINIAFFIIFGAFLLNSCAPFNSVDARKYPPNPELRVKKNLEEGRGFRIMDMVDNAKGTNYEFASSNELWRASLDAIDFMPLVSVNYSGGLIVSDWYSGNQNSNENIKISIRFLTNEIRSDALDIKIFKKICNEINKCTITQQNNSEIQKELKRKILKTAKIYEKRKKDKNFKPYKTTNVDN